MKNTLSITANSKKELLTILASLDVTVSDRASRVTKEVEKRAICYFLSTAVSIDFLEFPISVQHSDRPDFVLKMGGKKIGIEHTEAISEDEAYYSALREKGYGPEVYSLRRLQPGQKPTSRKEAINEIESDLNGDVWEGDQPEYEWANAMAHFVNVKTKKLAQEGFNKYSENWLLIYDNWPVPKVDRDKSIKYLRNILMKKSSPFDFVFILNDHFFCSISSSKSESYPLNDLWK
jgi:hypothetical protein